RRDWPKCPICGVPVEPAQYENHYRLELYELQQLNFSDFEQAKSRGKRGAAVHAKRQLEKTTGKRKVASRYEDCLEKIKKSRENRNAAIQGINTGGKCPRSIIITDICISISSTILKMCGTMIKNHLVRTIVTFDAGLQQTCFICNQVLSGDTESINLHIDGCLARMNFEGGQEEVALPTHNEVTTQEQSSGDGEAAEALSAAEWEEYEWAGQRRVRATAMLEGGYGGVGMSTTVKGEDVEDDLDVEDDDADEFGEAQYSERDIVVNQDDDNEDSAALREMVSGTTISRKNTPTQNATSLPGQRPGYEATVSDDGWKQHLLKDIAIPADAAGHTKLVIESLRAQITQLERASRSVPKCLICLEPYKTPLASVVCWHVHCEECWLHSMGTKKLCPQCQKIVTPTDLRRIYL
ncbi:hypothetical protein INT43_003805, partial [Umbelopsis isabellina]